MILSLFFGFAALALGQVSTPIAATRINGGFSLVNQSSKMITGYALKMEIFDAAGKGFRHSETAMRGLEPLPARQGWAPGEIWTHKSSLVVSGITLNVSVDSVIFADGTSWGQDTTQSVQRMRGIRTGWENAQAFLKQMLEKKGVQAVAEYLKSTN